MNSATQSFLGRYRLVKVLGQGAMGVVYEAVDTRLNRTVAIKTVLRSHMADETTANEYAVRFEREAQAAARLSHPHVVTVFDFGEHEDVSYIVMEFVRGRELNQAFEAGEKFTLHEGIRIMCELLQALDYAHQQGIVHRDVKPANVMLDHAGHVKLTDFGVARVASTAQDRTMPGTMVGTPSYMSPEQILGLAVGSRADIFAAGVILYQFLTGVRPFSGGGPFGVQRKIVQDDPAPPSKVVAGLPVGFDAIVARALAKKPEHRYDKASAFAADLERIGATLERAVPLIDLDLPAPVEAPPPAATMAAAADPNELTLITEVPFGSKPAEPPMAGETDDPSFDPDATIVMYKPSAPVPPPQPPAAVRTTAPPGRPNPTPAPAATLSGATGRLAPAPSAAAASPVPPAPPAPTMWPRAAPAQAKAPAPAPAAAGSRALLPVAAGAGLVVIGLTAWLLVTRPWSVALPRLPQQPAASSAAERQPALPAAVPDARPAAPSAAPAVTLPPKATTAAPPAAAAKPPPPAPSPPPRATAAVERRPAAPSPAVPSPAADGAPTGVESRCGDLLQRMQLGEALTPEQNRFFQTRCTR